MLAAMSLKPVRAETNFSDSSFADAAKEGLEKNGESSTACSGEAGGSGLASCGDELRFMSCSGELRRDSISHTVLEYGCSGL